MSRETLRDQLSERRVLPTVTQALLAEKLGFRVDWPEWSSGSASDFKARYAKEVPSLPHRSTRRMAIISGGVAGALLLVSSLALGRCYTGSSYLSGPVFDESKSAIIPGSDADGANSQHTLTALEPRSSNALQLWLRSLRIAMRSHLGTNRTFEIY